MLAWAVAAVSVAAAVAAARLDWAGRDAGGAPVPVKPVLLTVVWVVPGLLIASLRPRLVLGWLALGEALLFAASALGDAWIRYGADGAGADVAWAAWVTDRFSAFLAVGLWLLLVLLPDGRLPSPRWRAVVGGVVGVQCLALAAFATVRGPAAGPDSSLPAAALDVANPVGLLPASVGAAARGPGHGAAAGAAAAVPRRLRRPVAPGRARRAGARGRDAPRGLDLRPARGDRPRLVARGHRHPRRRGRRAARRPAHGHRAGTAAARGRRRRPADLRLHRADRAGRRPGRPRRRGAAPVRRGPARLRASP